MKKAILCLFALYAAALIFGLWKSFNAEGYYGDGIVFDLTMPFYEINQMIMTKIFGFEENYIDIFLSPSRQSYLILITVFSFFEMAIVFGAVHFLTASFPKLRKQRQH